MFNLIGEENFAAIIIKLDCAFKGKMLKVKNSYQLSPQLICIFFFLSFCSMDDLIKTLQLQLKPSRSAKHAQVQVSKFTFQFLSAKYLKNMSERKRKGTSRDLRRELKRIV